MAALPPLDRAAEEVRLRDLERKGVSRVRVLRPADIERMIERAVAEGLLAGARDRDALIQSSRKALQARMVEAQAVLAAAAKADEEIDRLQDENARLAALGRDAARRLGAAEAESAALVAEIATLEREERDLAAAVERAEGAAAEAAGAAARLERDAAALAARLARAEHALAGAGALAAPLAEAERAAAAAAARGAELEAALASVVG